MASASGALTKQERLWAQGEGHLAARNWLGAAECFRSIAEHDPSHVPALLHWSGALKQSGQYRAAHRQLHQALAVDTRAPGLLLELGRRLREFNEGAPLLELLRRSKFLETAPPPMLTDMAMRVSTLGANEEASALVQRSVALDPRNSTSRYLHASILMFQGRNEEARQEVEAALSLTPAYAQAQWLRSRLRKATLDDNAIDSLRAAAASPAHGPQAQVYLAYALHNELHDLGDFAGSWAALAQGMRIKRGLIQYDSARQSMLMRSVERVCSREFVEAPEYDLPYTPLFIVGMYRSGTTLLERILSGHSAVADGGETYIFTSQLRLEADYACRGVLDDTMVQRLTEPSIDFARIGRGFLNASNWRRRGRQLLTEKLPSNLLNSGFIAKAMPGARLLHMNRDPVDTCFSNLRTLFSDAAPYSYDQIELADYYADYLRLAAHWREVLGSRWLDVTYGALVADTEVQVRGVFDHCGLPFEAEALSVERSSGAVTTASAVDVRKGILRDRGNAWSPYHAQLAPLLDRLAARGVL